MTIEEAVNIYMLAYPHACHSLGFEEGERELLDELRVQTEGFADYGWASYIQVLLANARSRL